MLENNELGYGYSREKLPENVSLGSFFEFIDLEFNPKINRKQKNNPKINLNHYGFSRIDSPEFGQIRKKKNPETVMVTGFA